MATQSTMELQSSGDYSFGDLNNSRVDVSGQIITLLIFANSGAGMLNDVVYLYIFVSLCGALGGLIRFNESKKPYHWRVVTTSILLGWMISFTFIGFYWGEKIVEEPIKCYASAVAIGYVQPNIIELVMWIIKNRGGKVE